MADSKLSALTADTTPTSDDLLYVVNDPGGTPTGRKVTIANLAAALAANSTFTAALAASSAFTAAFAPSAGSEKVLAETTLGATTADITFSSIPATYKHLRIEGRCRATAATSYGYVLVQVGHTTVDSGTNYNGLGFQNITTDYSGDRTNLAVGRTPQNTASANIFSMIHIHIQDYLTTSYWRFIEGRGHLNVGGTGHLYTSTGHWKNTTQTLDVIKVYPDSGSWAAGTQLRLVGIAAP